MPVSGHGWYKRPYKVRFTDRNGKVKTLHFHWAGRAREVAEEYRAIGFDATFIDTTKGTE